MGEQSTIFQQQLYQHNYVEWFQQQPLTQDGISTKNATETNDDTNRENNNTTSDLLQDFAPVSSKWSDCRVGTDDDIVASLTPHVIDYVLLRKLVSAGYGLDDNDDDDDDDDDDYDCDVEDDNHLDGSHSHSPPQVIHRASRIKPGKKGYRAMAWRVLLGFLPADTNQWRLCTTTITNSSATKINDENEKDPHNHNDVADDDDDIKEISASGMTTDPSNNNENKTMVQQRRELYLSLVQELFVAVPDVTTIQAIELCGRNNKNKHAAYNQHRRTNQKDNDLSISSHNMSRTSSSSSLLSTATFTTGTDFVTTVPNTDHPEATVLNIVSSQLQLYWKEKGLDPFILERCCVTSFSSSGSSQNNNTNFNILRIQHDDHYWNNQEHHNKDNHDAVTTKAVAASTDEDSITMIKRDNLQDFVDNVLLLDEIRKDVIRTHPGLAFFLDPTVGARRYAAIERILFVWSKYNKGVRYVQGMNEIVGILYYVLANDQSDEWSIWAEADTFWLFNALIGGDDMRDVFISGFDEHDTGIHGRLITMQQLLQRHDPEVSEHLQEIGIEVSYYAIRWWTTLLCREFLLPDTIRLWDSMFASTHKDNFLRYVCVIMVMSIRDRLLKGDFTVCLQLLQDFPSTSVDQLLEASRALWIYESQISVACHRGGLTLHQALTTIESPKALIMAFGFVNGTPPPAASILKNPIVDDIKTATVQIEAKVRQSATLFLGRAKGWYNRYNNSKTDENKEEVQNTSTAPTIEETKQNDPAEIINDEDDIYMKAFLES